MKIWRSLLVTLVAIAAVSALVGCSTTQSVPIGAGSHSASNRSAAVGALAPANTGRDLLYASYGEDLNVYTYPRGRLLGSLGDVGGSLCSDKQGDVFTALFFAAEVLEYAHGAEMPKITLNDPYFAGPCSVDPTTGSVASVTTDNSVVVFPYSKRKGWRFAKTYTISDMEFDAFCGYDASGNLFVDGTNSTGGFAFDELPKSERNFKPVSLNQSFGKAGSVQWDGKYLTVADRGSTSNSSQLIYRFTITGSSGTEVGSTNLADSYGNAQYWIQGNRVTGAYASGGYISGIGIWAYPAGGSPLKNFASGAGSDSVTVSVPSK